MSGSRMRIRSAVIALGVATCGWAAYGQAPRAAPPERPFVIKAEDPSFDRLVAPDARLDTVAVVPGLRSEGPLWRKGVLWLSDMVNGRIVEVAPTGVTRTALSDAGGPVRPGVPTLQGPSCLVPWRDGSVLICRQGARDVGLLRRDGRLESLVSTYAGLRFNSPNDLVAQPDGTFWFTDPPYSRPGHPLARPAHSGDDPRAVRTDETFLSFNGVYRYSRGKVTVVVRDLPMPNGIAVSPDGRTLYVNNSLPQMFVRAYAIGRDGTISAGRDLIRFPDDGSYPGEVPDGLKVDAYGNLWVAGRGGLVVVSPAGKVLGRIQLPRRATNLAFGREKDLYLTAGPNIYRLPLRVSGLRSRFAPL